MWREVCKHFDETKHKSYEDTLLIHDHNIFPSYKNAKVPARESTSSTLKLPDIFTKDGTNSKSYTSDDMSVPRVNGVQSSLGFTTKRAPSQSKFISSKNYGYQCYKSMEGSEMRDLTIEKTNLSKSVEAFGHIGRHAIASDGNLVSIVKARQLKPMTPFQSFDKQQPIALLF